MKKVPSEETIGKLCRAVRELRKVSEVMGHGTPISEASSEVADAILDLMGIPADNSADGDFEKPGLFVRDWFCDELDKFIDSDEEIEVKPLMVMLQKEITGADVRN